MELPGRHAALLFGTSQLSELGETVLPDPHDELARLGRVLLDPDVGGYEHVEMFTNEPLRTVRPGLKRFVAPASDAHTLVVHYVGYGFTDSAGTFYLAVTDSHPDRLDRTALPLRDVIDAVSGAAAYGAIVILDCLYDGTIPLRDHPAYRMRAQPGNTAVIAMLRNPSVPSSERPSPTQRIAESLISGAADVDGDGLVEVDDLYNYLQQSMTEPVINRSSHAPLYLARNPAPTPPTAPPQAPAYQEQVSKSVPDVPGPFPVPTLEAPEPVAEAPQLVPEAAQQPAPPQPVAQQPAPETAEPPVDDDVDWVHDAPAREDLLRRRDLAELVALRLTEIHRKDPDTSVLLHLDGAWGTGKSTLLNLLETELADDFWVTRFDAWQQSRVAPPWWALLTATRAELVRRRPWWRRGWLRLAETAARARRSGAPYLLALLLVLGVAGVVGYALWPTVTTVKSLTAVLQMLGAVIAPLTALTAGALVAGRFLLWDSARGARVFEQSDTNPMAEVASHFAWLIDRADQPLVFFVDDLDRCHQEYVVEFLEAIQTLVRQFPSQKSKQTAHFVVAADGAWLRRSYEVAYQTFDESVAAPARPLGHLFLDKLFQLTVPMPELGRTTQAGYLDQMLQVTAAEAEELQREVREAKQTLDAHRGDETAILGTLDAATPQVRDLIKGDAALALAQPQTRRRTNHSLRKFAPLLDANPRSMKKFLNTYSMLRSVRTLEANTVVTDALALWAILLVRWPSLAEFLAAQPDAVTAIVEPVWISDVFPERLRPVAADPEVRAVITCGHGGPLTPALIRQCRGATDGHPA